MKSTRSSAVHASIRPRFASASVWRVVAERVSLRIVAIAGWCCVAPALAQEKEWWFTNQPEVTMFGHTILSFEDADGDGVDDLIVTAPLAYSADGRTGSVLVLSSASGKILRRLDGPPRRERFGWGAAIVSRDASGRADAIALTSVECTLKSRWPYRLERKYATSVYSLPSWEFRCRIDGELQTMGSPGDVDGDGTSDILVDIYGEGWDCDARWHSTSDGRRIDHSAPPCSARLLEEDYDSDGLKDLFDLDPETATRARVISSRTQAVLSIVSFKHSAEIPQGSAIAGPGNVDGKRPILVDMSWPLDGTSEIVAYSGKDGRILDLRGVEPESAQSGGGYVYSFHVIPDMDSDGHEDLITLSAYYLRPHVSAWSGKSLDRIWRTEGVVGIGSSSIATVLDRRESAARVVLAIGGSCYVPPSDAVEFFGPDDPICIVDAKTGVTLRSFDVKNYPEIAHPSLRADGKKK